MMRTRKLERWILWFLLAGIALSSGVGLFSEWFALLDLFNHFRPHLIVLSLVAGVVALPVDKKAAAVSLALLLLNAGAVGMRMYVFSGVAPIHALPPAESGMRVSLVASNVLTRNTGYQRLLDLIARENPDIVVLTETDERWVRQLSALRARYPFHAAYPRPNNFGIAVYSTRPFTARMMRVGEYGLPLAIIDYEGFVVMAAHPIPPTSPRNWQENNNYLEIIAQISAASDKPVIVAGDLNATLWSDAVTPLRNAGLKSVNAFKPAYTWPVHMPLFAMQIDHVFVRGVAAADFKVLESIGSDHYPVKATMILPASRT